MDEDTNSRKGLWRVAETRGRRYTWSEGALRYLPLITGPIALILLVVTLLAENRTPWFILLAIATLVTLVRFALVEEAKQVVLVKWHGKYITLPSGPRFFLAFDRIRFIVPTWKIGHDTRIEFIAPDGVTGYMLVRIFIRITDAARAYRTHGEETEADLVSYGENALRQAIATGSGIIAEGGGGALQNWGSIESNAIQLANEHANREADDESGWGAEITNFVLVDFELPGEYMEALTARAAAQHRAEANQVEGRARTERLEDTYTRLKNIFPHASLSDLMQLESMQTAVMAANAGGSLVWLQGSEAGAQAALAGSYAGVQAALPDRESVKQELEEPDASQDQHTRTDQEIGDTQEIDSIDVMTTPTEREEEPEE